MGGAPPWAAPVEIVGPHASAVRGGGPVVRPGSVARDDDRGTCVATNLPLILIGLLLVGAVPVWPWSRGWGWAPFGIVAVGFATLLLFRFSVVAEA